MIPDQNTTIDINGSLDDNLQKMLDERKKIDVPMISGTPINKNSNMSNDMSNNMPNMSNNMSNNMPNNMPNMSNNMSNDMSNKPQLQNNNDFFFNPKKKLNY